MTQSIEQPFTLLERKLQCYILYSPLSQTMANFLQTCLILVAVSLSAINALSCVDYVIRNNEKQKDPSPPAVDCDGLEYHLIDLGNNSMLGISKNSKLNFTDTTFTTRLSLHNTLKTAYSCFKITMGNTAQEDNRAIDFALTHRGCLLIINVEESLKDKCYEGKNSEIQNHITEHSLQVLMAQYQEIYTDEMDVGVCTCGDDDCNEAGVTAALSKFVLLTLLVFAYFR
ncbi:hypothetical protein Ocin01_15644 [Orchesella cincta]|uniref:Uncharacterized protein n=1 Tax=Orchesella cincta TaxID=48709 RepID=A0A1D2MDL6_ORCCI|nr:hypothetical protein Ocin01_15644 [Orchesella cincta]